MKAAPATLQESNFRYNFIANERSGNPAAKQCEAGAVRRDLQTEAAAAICIPSRGTGGRGRRDICLHRVGARAGRERISRGDEIHEARLLSVAIQGFDRALKTWSGHAECYFERGNANHILGHDEEAMADYEKAVDLNPNLYRAYAAMGAIYREKKDYRRAMEAYTKSISAKPNVDAYFERGQTYVALGDFQKAIDDYDKAIQEMPDSPAVYRARGLARRSIGDEAGYEADRDAASRIEHRQ